MEEAYRAMRADVRARGLYERTYGYYALYGFLVLCGTGLSLYFITVTNNIFLQLLNSLFLTFMLVQAGMLGHDFSHGQVFETRETNRFFAMFMWGLFAGASETVWYDQHNAHHEHVNQQDMDPDINIPFLFADGQRLGDFSFAASLYPYQHILFFATLPFWYLSKLCTTWLKVFKDFSFRRSIEVTLAGIHFGVLFYLLFAYQHWWVALLFLAVHVFFAGLYLSSAFAPNHKGEEIHPANEETTWMHQITSTRNIYPSLFIFHFFGGLNFQIEHHLFPNMPRPNYWKAHEIVKKFCQEHGIPYHETTWLGSMREIYIGLRTQARAFSKNSLAASPF